MPSSPNLPWPRQVSHAQYSVLDRIELRHLTYGGISVGWGWARHAKKGTYSSDNVVSRCSVHHFKTLLGDGGGIYALGPQPRSVMRANWLHTMAAGRGGGAFYPDEGLTHWDMYTPSPSLPPLGDTWCPHGTWQVRLIGPLSRTSSQTPSRVPTIASGFTYGPGASMASESQRRGRTRARCATTARTAR